MTVVFPKLPENQRWLVTKPELTHGGHYCGYVKVQKKRFWFWVTIREKNYFPRIRNIDLTVGDAVKDLSVEPHPDDFKYVGVH